MAFWQAGEARIFYTDQGTGDVPVVLVHGWSCDSSDWIWLIPELAQSYRVIAVDLRGHGHSEAPATGYGPEAFAEELEQFLDHLELSKPVIVGHSMGGVVGSILAVAHPSRLAGLVVIDPPYGFDHDGALRNIGLVSALEQGPANEIVADFFGVLEGADTPPALVELHRRRALGTPAHVVLETAKATHAELGSVVNSPNTERLLAARKTPTLAFHLTEQRAEWERTLSASSQSESVAFEGAGHWLHQERPAQFSAVLQRWLNALTRSALAGNSAEPVQSPAEAVE